MLFGYKLLPIVDHHCVYRVSSHRSISGQGRPEELRAYSALRSRPPVGHHSGRPSLPIVATNSLNFIAVRISFSDYYIRYFSFYDSLDCMKCYNTSDQ